MSKVGSIKIILGCMYAGKTSKVITEYRKWHSISRKAICINFAGDERYGADEAVYSHDLVKITCIKVGKLEQVRVEDISDADMILINEGQFFPDLVKYCVDWCERLGLNLIVSGLDGDYKREPFGSLLDLIPYADHIEKITAFCSLCKDGTEANFSHRLSREKEQVVIGNNYLALCRKHYVEQNGGDDNNNDNDNNNEDVMQ